MKILLLHNLYRSNSPSGENQVFGLEHDLLLKHGHDVRQFTRHSDELTAQGALGKIKGTVSVPWNPSAPGPCGKPSMNSKRFFALIEERAATVEKI